jgi:hypothetical protein
MTDHERRQYVQGCLVLSGAVTLSMAIVAAAVVVVVQVLRWFSEVM